MRYRPAAALTSHRSRTDQAVEEASIKVKSHPNQPVAYAELAIAFMQKARETADAAYFSRAEAACEKALKIKPDSYEALQILPWIYGNQHRFTEAVTAARRVILIDPADAWNFGTLGDALAELGEYDASAQAIDQMVGLHPDSGSYARVAHQRELRGDTAGASQIMQMAADTAATSTPENAAWCQVQLGNIRLNAGQFNEAESNYRKATELYPEYYFALAGLGRVKAARGEFNEAVALFRRSLDIAPRQETVIWLGDTLLKMNQPEEAARQFELLEVIEKILRANGVIPSTQMALFYADHDQRLDDAVGIAKQCATERKDVRTQDALAWTLFKAGQTAEASVEIRKALRLGTRDALFYYHAGMIEAKLGNLPRAIAALRKAIEINPEFDVRHADEARAMLTSLEGAPPVPAATQAAAPSNSSPK